MNESRFTQAAMTSRLRAQRIRWPWIALAFFACATQQMVWCQTTSQSQASGAIGIALEKPTVSVDRDEVQVADPFQLTIAVNVANGSTVQFPVLPESLGVFNVISHRDYFDVPIEGGRSWTRVIELETFETGNLQIPTFSLVIDGETKTTSPVQMTVASLLDSTADLTRFRGLKDVEEIPVESVIWKWTLAGVLLLVAILAALWFVIARYRNFVNDENWALEQLDKLTNSLAFHQRNQTVVLPASADILRSYIQRKFHIAATQQTTEEFLRRIQHDPILDHDSKRDLEVFLSHVDKIKFAHLVPEDDHLQQTITLVRTFVQRCGDSRQDASLTDAALAEAVHEREQVVTASPVEDAKSKSSSQEGEAGNVVAH